MKVVNNQASLPPLEKVYTSEVFLKYLVTLQNHLMLGGNASFPSLRFPSHGGQNNTPGLFQPCPPLLSWDKGNISDLEMSWEEEIKRVFQTFPLSWLLRENSSQEAHKLSYFFVPQVLGGRLPCLGASGDQAKGIHSESLAPPGVLYYKAFLPKGISPRSPISEQKSGVLSIF